MKRRRQQFTGRFAQLAHSMGLFKFFNRVDNKDTVKSLFNRPKIISCESGRLRLEWGLLQRVKGPNLLLGGLK